MLNEYTNLIAEFGIGGAHPGGLSFSKEILTNENIDSNDIILEVGCGTGQTTAYLALNGHTVVPIDSHPKMVEKANNRFQQLYLPCKAQIADIHDLPFEKDSFDIVIAESVLSFTNLDQSLANIHDVLKEGGKLIALEMTKKDSIKDEFLGSIKKHFGTPQILSKSMWENKLKKHGYDPIRFQTMSLHDLPTPEQDIAPSDMIDDKYYELMFKHEKIVRKSRNMLSLGVIVAQK
ncbi:class I SAM-dependent methyltransferase [Sutcliffiella cohnii]|uniref:Methyltransferase type 11 domain-containing protein n=1 Tax=Sutcliffiella cohnii TaxID=33932 RepID=A0A223KQP8_9BACI|nr:MULTISPECIES: class I SAM-dependent methyltransferase [Sutcliffiella]AST91820.1 hypothetical protein BC6307_11295 [Sutcliffiella cohnii]MED4018627.1 class I SAM-dependent methyltransferase [Sutcliffiella cohnii]WBL13040.1 class I SAM-dependent methyltransferase [Sutcliffiella sp. NC1]